MILQQQKCEFVNTVLDDQESIHVSHSCNDCNLSTQMVTVLMSTTIRRFFGINCIKTKVSYNYILYETDQQKQEGKTTTVST